MKLPRLLVLPFLFIFGLFAKTKAQSVIVLDSCGVSYVDPQDQSGNNSPGLDTLTYTSYFEEKNQLRNYFIDINAFGGSQVDRARVFAIFPGGDLTLLGGLAFGNCLDCVQGFALVYNDSLLVDQVGDVATMERWLQSLNQPDYALPGNLQTLKGVGRISGELPVCAEGIFVEYIVNSNPQSSSTEFSTHIICPEIIRDCSIEKQVQIDCLKDSIFLDAFIPSGCYAQEATIRWYNELGWSSDGPSASLSLSGNEGKYYLSLEDGYCQIIDSVTVENPPFADAGTDERRCEGESITLSGAGGIRHYWELPDGGKIDSAVAVLPDLGPENEGFYILHGFNEEGCEDTDTLILRVDVAPDPVVEISDACLGDTLTISLANDSLYIQKSWFDPQGQMLAEPVIPDFQLPDFGEYRVVAVDRNDCETEKAFEVSGSEPPEYEYTIEESCDSTRVYLSPLTYQYSWETGDEGPYFATATGGLYQLTITDANGCSALDEIDTPFPDGPAAGLKVTQPECPSDFGIIEILVDERDPFIFSIDGGQNYFVNPVFDKLDTGGYEIVIQDALGCTRDYFVEILPPDTMGVELNYDRLEVRPFTPVSLTARTTGNIQTIQWLPEEIDSGDRITEFTAINDMDVRIIVEDSKGCIASAGFPLTIVLGNIYAPNAFSPNDDGYNDHFTLYSDNGSGEVIELLRIFDRWGGLVFETEEIALNDETRGWDGRFNGVIQSPGVFTYFGVVRFGNGVKKELKGDVALVR